VQSANERSYWANRNRMTWAHRGEVENGRAGAVCATNVVERDRRGKKEHYGRARPTWSAIRKVADYFSRGLAVIVAVSRIRA